MPEEKKQEPLPEYAENDKKVAKALLSGPKDISELRSAAALSADEIARALRHMIMLRVVEQASGSKYKLIDKVENAVKLRREAQESAQKGKFLLHALIEGASESKEALEKQMQILEERFRKEPIYIQEFKKFETLEEKGIFTSFFDVSFRAKTFQSVISFIVSFGPSSIEVIEPESFTLSQQDIQGLFGDVTSAVHYYVAFITNILKKQQAQR